MQVIFAQYLNSVEDFEINDFIFSNGMDYQQLLVKAQTALLKENGYPQKGWTAYVVEDEVFAKLAEQFPNLKSVEFA